MDSIYGKHFYLNTSPITVVGELHGRVYWVPGHHNFGHIAVDKFWKQAQEAN